MASTRRTAALRALWVALWAARRPGVPGVRERLAAVPRMLRLGLGGRYPFLDKRRLGLVLLGLVYLVSPLDFIPEMFLPLIGLGDDAVVVTWMVGSLLAEAGDFLEWERDRSRTVAGEVVG
ncbi:MAG TPA: YkvA family protein [Kineosporiaceae bacterium]|nr:YkvA family protein [Kineosporiaceae bacterium]